MSPLVWGLLAGPSDSVRILPLKFNLQHAASVLWFRRLRTVEATAKTIISFLSVFQHSWWPFLQALRSKAENIRASELERTMSKMGEGLSKKQTRAVEELSKAIVNKLLHGPMTALRCGFGLSWLCVQLAWLGLLHLPWQHSEAAERDGRARQRDMSQGPGFAYACT